MPYEAGNHGGQRIATVNANRSSGICWPLGATGLVVLASGRYTETEVDLDELVGQGRQLRRFWVGLAQLPRSHPFTVRRLDHLYRIGLFHGGVPQVQTRV